MKERTIDILTSVFLIIFGFIMLGQLENVPREGILFPKCVLYLIMACGVLLALRAFLTSSKGVISFFEDIPPHKWHLASAIFIVQVLGAMYVSFNICMSIGIFSMLMVLTPCRNAKSFFINLAVTVAFIAFFNIFFTNIMNIYFPEPIFG